MRLDSKMTIRELLKSYPLAIDVFVKRKMLCVGCPTQAYHTLEDVARIYGYTVYALLKTIGDAIQIKEEQ